MIAASTSVPERRITPFSPDVLHFGKDCLWQRMVVQKVAEVQDRGFVRNTVISEFQTGEAAHSVAVVEASSAIGSLSASHCLRSMVFKGIAGRPPLLPTFG
jgi:hypothetical protein